jgi:hypothetical protein
MLRSYLIFNCCVLALSGSFASRALADPGSHFDAGVHAFEEHRFAESADEFERAYAMEPAWQVLYNLGTVYVILGRPVDAVRAFEGYLHQNDGTASPTRIQEVEAELVRERAKVATLESRKELPAELAPAVAPPATHTPLMPPSTAAPPAEHGGTFQRVMGWTVGGVGVLGLAAGVLLTVNAQYKHDEAAAFLKMVDPSAEFAAQVVGRARKVEKIAATQMAVGVATLAVGAAACTTGLILLLTAPSESEKRARVQMSGWASASSAGMTLRGAW